MRGARSVQRSKGRDAGTSSSSTAIFAAFRVCVRLPGAPPWERRVPDPREGGGGGRHRKPSASWDGTRRPRGPHRGILEEGTQPSVCHGQSPHLSSPAASAAGAERSCAGREMHSILGLKKKKGKKKYGNLSECFVLRWRQPECSAKYPREAKRAARSDARMCWLHSVAALEILGVSLMGRGTAPGHRPALPIVGFVPLRAALPWPISGSPLVGEGRPNEISPR